MLKDYGIDLQIKFMDGNALWKMLMERNFTIYYESWAGITFPNPETSFHSSLADQKNNNNIYGFKNKRVDELCELYDKEFDIDKRVEILREIDGIVADTRVSAWTTHRPYQRLIFWDKFGYPEYMVSRYTGDYRSIYSLWWFEQEKVTRLYDAIAKDQDLPQGEIKVTFWPDYIKAEKRSSSEKSVAQ
jgi:microcin C transport system substrate-binding protein